MGKLKILLVDDEKDFLELMSIRIKGWGYEVLCASSGKEAAAIVSDQKPQAIILDYIMPEMDGVATLKKIRKIDRVIPVIMFTAHPDTKSIKGTGKLGVSAYIPKLSAYTDVTKSLKTALKMIEKRGSNMKMTNNKAQNSK